MKKLRKRKIVKIQYYIYCPICKHEVKGNSSSQVEYNLKIHMERKHGNNK